MTRRPSRIRTFALALLATASSGWPAATCPAQPPIPLTPSIEWSLSVPKADPIPIQRVLVPTGRLPIELERARKGTLVQLSREEFEARVRLAVDAEEALNNPPRLLETSFRATLDNDDLVGTGQWIVSNPNNRAGILQLAGLNLALRRCRNGNADAVIGDLDGKGQGLLVEKSGKETIAIEWSARGSPGPEGVRFELKLPACALTKIELDLPVDRSPVISQDTAVIVGPLPAIRPEHRLWQIHCAGWSQLDLLIRHGRGPEGAAPMILARIQTRQEITPSKIEAEFDLSLDVSHQSVRQLVCICEGDFHATAVNLRNVEINTWQFQPATQDRPALLTIPFPEALEGNAIPVRIKGLAPFPGRSIWSCAGIRPVGATTTRESMTLRFDPEFAIDDWSPGRFDLLKTSTEKAGAFILSLQSGTQAFVEPNAAVKPTGTPASLRPSGRLRFRSAACNVRQYSAWRLAAGGESFKTALNYQVLRGPISALAIRIGAGWTVDKVELSPQGALGHWDLEPGQGDETVLQVNLEQTLQSGGRVKLVLESRPAPTRSPLPKPGRGGEKPVLFSFPYAAPLRVNRSESILEIGPDPVFRISEPGADPARVASANTLIAQAFARPQWSIKQPSFTFAQQQLPITGTLLVAPRAPEAGAPAPFAQPSKAQFGDGELPARIPTVRRVQRVTTADQAGKLTSRFDFELHDWPERLLPLRLPPGNKLITASVDGIVMDRFTVDDLPDHWSQLHVHVPAGRHHHYEIWYEAQANAVFMRSRWTAPIPVLPLEWNEFRQLWCLPSGVSPSGPEQLLPIPRLTTTDDLQARRPGGAHSPSVQNADVRQIVLRNATGRLREEMRGHPEGWRLGDFLNRLDTELNHDGECLVIDADAFGQANWSPATLLPAKAGWAERFDLRELGFLAIPTESSFLLTTLREAGNRGLIATDDKVLSTPLEKAVESAARYGRDSSGSYQRCSGWTSRTSTDAASSLILPTTCTEWEAQPGTPTETTIVVYRSDVANGMKAVLGLMFFLAGCLLPLPTNLRRILITVVAAILILGAASSLPTPFAGLIPWPLYAFLLTLGLRWIFARRGPKAAAPTPPALASVAFVAALLLLFSFPADGAPPAPYIVWFVRNGEASPERWTALASPDLLEQLQTLAQRGARGLRGTAIMAAEYEGAVEDGSVNFTANYRLHTFSEGDSSFNLPLNGVDLLDATLDGKPAYPTAAEVPPNSYQFKVQGRGSHQLQLRFVARVQGDGADLSCRLGTPEVPQSRLRFLASRGASYLHAVHARGAQSVTEDAKGKHLVADLGNGNGIELSWRVASEKKTAPVLRVREEHYWDLQAYSGRLLSLLQFSVVRGAPTTLDFVIPETMEVRRVEATAFPAGSRLPRLRQWRVSDTGEKRTLQVDFQVPITAGVQIYLELLPRTSFSRDTILAVPTPLGAESLEGLLAFRVEGQGLTPVEYQRITGIPTEVFARRWQAAGTEDPGTPDRAFSFRRTPGNAPILRLGLAATRAPARYSEDIVWRLSPNHAEVRTTAKVTRMDQDINLVEWLLPAGLTIEELSGSEVRSWSRSTKGIQIWLDHSTGETRLELHGNMACDAKGFHLPPLGIASATHDHTLIRLLADGGHAVVPIQVAKLAPLPETIITSNQRSYMTRDTDYSGDFELVKTQLPHAQTLTTVALENDRCSYRLRLTIAVPQVQPRSVVLQLRNWMGQDLRLDPAHGCAIRALARAPGIRSWLLEPITAHPKVWQVDLSASLPFRDQEQRVLPTVDLDGAELVTTRVAVQGTGLTLQPASGIVLEPLDDKLLQEIKLAAPEFRDGSLWRVSPGIPLEVSRRTRPGPGSNPVVLYEEHRAAQGNGRHWTHEALYRILAPSGADLKVRLPEHAEPLRVTIAGVDAVSPLSPDGEYTIELAANPNPRSLLLSWRYGDGVEDINEPRLEQPHLSCQSEEVSADTIWKVLIPPGYRPEVAEGRSLPGAEVGAALRQATAEIEAYRRFFEGVDPQDISATALLQDTDRLCHKAETLLHVRQIRASLGNYSEILNTRLRELLEIRNKLAGKKLPDWSMPMANDTEDWAKSPGLPTYWERTGPTAPVLHLVPQASAGKATEPVVALAFLGACFLGFGFCAIPVVGKVLVRCWPEFALILGIVGWGMVGFNGAVLITLVLGITARLLDIYRWSVRFARASG